MSKIATRDAYGKTLVKLGETNDNVVVLDADLSKSTKTDDSISLKRRNKNCSRTHLY